MLQYTVQLPPLSLSSSKRSKANKSAKSPHPARHFPSDDHQHSVSTNASTIPSLANPSFPSKRGPLAYDKLPTARPPFPSSSHHATPLSISTSIAPSPLSSGPPSAGSASPSLSSAKTMHRSPLISSVARSSGTRSPHPLKSKLPSVNGSRPGTATASCPEAETTSPYFFSNPSQSQAPSESSSLSSTLADVLSAGDLVGEGLTLNNELIYKVPIPAPHSDTASESEPAQEFEVVRKLGTGSYAVVYLVREILEHKMVSATPSSSVDGHVAAFGKMDFDSESEDEHGFAPRKEKEERVYGREYAIKVLSKANLDEDALDAQLFEATMHQSLRPHPNIVTLHRTLETREFLLLLLEFVPGEDLFYFLEQSRDHYSPPPVDTPAMSPTAGSPSGSPNSTSSSSHTPPTPSLLSSLHPSHLLSNTRLRLIASMFSQMCDAVAACHEQRVFHRDIKPENFIVTDAWVDKPGKEGGGVRRERRVVVKLTDFGLGTMDEESADMDCGSAPYMSFECRNNIHPTYSPRAADVWSLGIVLINMLYHYNPWSDTTQGVCPSFAQYLRDPVTFFMSHFTGMTLSVAQFLAERVFCILDDPRDVSKRVSAAEFGRWARDLPALFNPPSEEGKGHKRTVSVSSTVGYTLASVPQSRRPSLRRAPFSGDRSSWALGGGGGVSRAGSQRASWAMSRQPSFVGVDPSSALPPPVEETSMEMAGDVLPSMLDHELEHEHEHEEEQGQESHKRGREQEQDGGELGAEQDTTQSRSTSIQKRRKRGARKGKGAAAGNGNGNVNAGTSTMDDTLSVLAEASQTLARQISRTSRCSGQVPHDLQSHLGPSALSISALSNGSPGLSVPLLPQVPPSSHPHLQMQNSSSSSFTSLNGGNASSSGLQLSRGSGTSRVPTLLNTSSTLTVSPASSSPNVVTPTTPTAAAISKKPSKWKLSFGKGSHHSQQSHGSSSNNNNSNNGSNNVPPLPSSQVDGGQQGTQTMSVTATSVTNLILGLNAPPPSTTSHYPKRAQATSNSKLNTNPNVHSNGSQVTLDEAPAWRATKAAAATWGPSHANSAFGATGPYQHSQHSASTASWGSSSNQPHTAGGSASSTTSVNHIAPGAAAAANERDQQQQRAVSPTGTRSGRPSSSASNWRSSMSSTGTGGASSAASSSSAFTRYSNGSMRSVSTAATSVSSASSRRSGVGAGAAGKYPYEAHTLPPNVKLMSGTPWELDQLPRQMYINPDEARFGAPPSAKRRQPKKEPPSSASSKLGTIDEWPNHHHQQQQQQQHQYNQYHHQNKDKHKDKEPEYQQQQQQKSPSSSPEAKSSSFTQRQDAATSTTDLARDPAGGSPRETDDPSSPRKVQKGQINALAKMLSALRR